MGCQGQGKSIWGNKWAHLLLPSTSDWLPDFQCAGTCVWPGMLGEREPGKSWRAPFHHHVSFLILPTFSLTLDHDHGPVVLPFGLSLIAAIYTSILFRALIATRYLFIVDHLVEGSAYNCQHLSSLVAASFVISNPSEPPLGFTATPGRQQLHKSHQHRYA